MTKFSDDFAKLYEIDGEQVLFFVEPGEDDTYVIHQITNAGGLFINAKAEGIAAERIDEAFAKITADRAAAALRDVRALAGELVEDVD